MNYNKKNNICQLTINKNLNQNETSNNYLRIPCDLERFVNTSTDKINKNDKTIYHFHGYVELDQDELIFLADYINWKYTIDKQRN